MIGSNEKAVGGALGAAYIHSLPSTIFKAKRKCSVHSNAVKAVEGLEPLCCKKWQKIVPDQLLVWGIRAH